MANPTTNYGWPMPTSSDLVTDLPADFDAFGQPVDNTLKALNPETTLGDIAYRSAVSNTNTRLGIGSEGQVLSVSSGVPAWTTTADVTPLTTKGDLFTFTTVDARLGVGANGTVLTAASGEATGLEWAAPASNPFVGCAVGRTTNLTVSNNVDTVIPYTTELYDTDSFHDNSNNPSRITIPSGQDGKYLITVITIFENNGTGQRQQMLNKNGLQFNWLFIESVSSAASYSVLTGAIVLDLVATDYIEINVKQNSGGNRTLFGDSAMLQVSKIG